MSVEFRVHGFRFEMPPACACCLAATERRERFPDPSDPTAPLTAEVPRFPWCDRCHQHAQARRILWRLDRAIVIGGPLLVMTTFALCVLFRTPLWVFLSLAALLVVAFVAGHIGAVRTRARLRTLPGCATGDLPVQVFREGEDSWRLVFENGDFARQFVRLNLPEGPALGAPREGALFPQSEAPGRGLLASTEQARRRTFPN